MKAITTFAHVISAPSTLIETLLAASASAEKKSPVSITRSAMSVIVSLASIGSVLKTVDASPMAPPDATIYMVTVLVTVSVLHRVIDLIVVVVLAGVVYSVAAATPSSVP